MFSALSWVVLPFSTGGGDHLHVAASISSQQQRQKHSEPSSILQAISGIARDQEQSQLPSPGHSFSGGSSTLLAVSFWVLLPVELLPCEVFVMLGFHWQVASISSQQQRQKHSEASSTEQPKSLVQEQSQKPVPGHSLGAGGGVGSGVGASVEYGGGGGGRAPSPSVESALAFSSSVAALAAAAGLGRSAGRPLNFSTAMLEKSVEARLQTSGTLQVPPSSQSKLSELHASNTRTMPSDKADRRPSKLPMLPAITESPCEMVTYPFKEPSSMGKSNLNSNFF
mmetsp:Transcript_53004/g.139013  ORF Transcript_53004/g.139013 Transcript_53004/m.139013 type:complete len:282 (+) Transcript_53004:608-1453(+)